ncbi:MAG: alanine racemase, partial [Nocardioides sp.]|uniref:alanine racemase n=1 Tax=Nocardioides sp. TaxID=35761 RepID=UPI003265FAC4
AEGVRQLGSALTGTDARVLIELESGNERTGVRLEGIVEIARAIEREGLHLGGVFTHGGQSYAGRDRVAAASADEVGAISIAVEALEAAGFAVPTRSVGSTPTAIDSAQGPVNEIRPGTYVYNDRLQVQLGSCAPEDVALLVATTVVSHSGGRFVLDAGAKTLTKDVPAVLQGFGALPHYPQAVIERVYDHHAIVDPGDGGRPAIGEIVAVVPNHVCPVVDLAATAVIVSDGEMVDRWQVDAHNRSG